MPGLECTVLSPLMRMMTPCMRLKQESAAPKTEAHTRLKIEDQIYVVESVCLKRRKEEEVKEKENGEDFDKDKFAVKQASQAPVLHRIYPKLTI